MKTITILVLVIFSNLLLAQNKFEDYKFELDSGYHEAPVRFQKIIGVDDTKIYVLFKENIGRFLINFKPFIYSFDKETYKFINKKQIKLKYDNYKFKPYYIEYIDNKLIVILEHYIINGKNNHCKIFIQELDKNTLLPKYEIRKIYEVKNRKLSNFVDYKLSDDKLNIVFWNLIDSKSTKDKNVYELNVFDSNFNKLYSVEHAIPKSNSISAIKERIQIDNDANVIFYESYREYSSHLSKKWAVGDKFKPHNYITLYSLNNIKGRKIDLSNEDYEITEDLKIKSSKEDIVIIGTHKLITETYNKKRFLIRISKETSEITCFKYFDYDIDGKAFFANIFDKKLRIATSKIYINDINEIFVISYISKLQRWDNGQSTEVYYVFGDLIITKILENNEVEWMKIIEKNNLSNGGKDNEEFDEDGFKSVFKDNEIFLVYNNGSKRMELDKDVVFMYTPTYGETTHIELSKINSEGDVEINRLHDYHLDLEENKGKYADPNKWIMSGDEVIIFIDKLDRYNFSENFQLGKIIIDTK